MIKLANKIALASLLETKEGMEKQALNHRQILNMLRNAAVDTNLGTRPNALTKMLHNLAKRNSAVNKVYDTRVLEHKIADSAFEAVSKLTGRNHLADLVAGGAGKLKGDLGELYKLRARSGNRIPRTDLMYEKSPAGQITSLDDLKKLENKSYYGHSAY